MSADSYQSLIEQSGISLDSLGVADVAFTRRDALRAVEALQADERLILGGDAYYRCGATVGHALSNWYVERKADEPDADLLRRSWDAARRFVTQHGMEGTDEALFSFVVEGYSSTARG